MKKLIIPALLFLAVSCSQEKKLLRKAAVAVDQYQYDKAVSYYDQLLAKDSNSFYGNAGKGIVLSEYMGKYDQAIPYLEKALKKSPDKNKQKINSDLGKSYHYIGSYERALYFYGKAAPKNVADDPDYDMMLSKRIADCKYALEHPQVASYEEQHVKNVGPVINTSFPEYGPIFTNGNLIYTAQKKDTPKEKVNGVEKKYFESMYISSYKDGEFSPPRRYTIPDKAEDSKFRRGGEAALSASRDGKTLYVFREGKIYETNLDDSTKRGDKLPANINFSNFQGFACVSADGKMLLFTSESKNGRGGTDIYKSVKDDNGNWSDPKLLPSTINTFYNEDAPFLAEDGTLYFSSEGLPGYGGYDVYKTTFKNGEWSEPVNLGQPINTPADDIYFVLNPNSSKGFYSSNRKGGFGEMDIYHVHYMNSETPVCNGAESPLAINAVPAPNSQLDYILSAEIPAQYKANVRSVSWEVNGQGIAGTGERVDYVFAGADTYTVSAKVVVYCDTCPAYVAMCNEKIITVGQPLVALNETQPADKHPKVIQPSKAKEKTTSGKAKTFTPGETLNEDQLNAMGWNSTPSYFDYDEYELREDAKTILDQNISILKQNRDLKLVINGYADSRGTTEYNKQLSAKRANSVKNYIVNNGISSRRISTIHAYGESMISNGCTDGADCTEEQHQLNRKVDFIISTQSKFITVAFLP